MKIYLFSVNLIMLSRYSEFKWPRFFPIFCDRNYFPIV